jgi:hypothetical protein
MIRALAPFLTLPSEVQAAKHLMSGIASGLNGVAAPPFAEYPWIWSRTSALMHALHGAFEPPRRGAR